MVGGYDPSLAPEAYEDMGVDYLVRSEGEVTFRELLRALEKGCGFEGIGGLSYRNGENWVHNLRGRRTGWKTAKSVRRSAMRAC